MGGRVVLLLMLLLMTILTAEAEDGEKLLQTIDDTLATKQEQPRKMSWLRRTIRGFSYIDTNYVEPQHYNWSVMLQGTYNYDYYRLSSKGNEHQSVTFAPKSSMKVGPYFGWRWVFLGYTFDLRRVDVSKRQKQELDLSIYAAQLGADFYYRRTGSDYHIRDVDLGKGINRSDLEDVEFDGLSVGITGLNVYYIFNHQRFSYPAAFAQSTMQKRSCGSWMVGLGYMQNSLDFDHNKLADLVKERTHQEVELDSGLMFNSVKYSNTNISVGYAYNWVFAKNFLFCASLSLALAYKKSKGDVDESDKKKRYGLDFNFDNVNIDGIGRFAVVYNNNRWYAGASAIVRSYNYHKAQFAANNVFGSLNMYVGYNFGAREAYKKKKK